MAALAKECHGNSQNEEESIPVDGCLLHHQRAHELDNHENAVHLHVTESTVELHGPYKSKAGKYSADRSYGGQVHVVVDVITSEHLIAANEQVTIEDRTKVHGIE